MFFEELELAEPDVSLGVGSGSHAEQTARIMLAFERELTRIRPGGRPRRRRRELDARLRARRGQGAVPGRARRGRPALLRPVDAGGDQPASHRPPVDATCSRPASTPTRTSAARASRRADPLRRQRDDRHAAALPRRGAGERRAAAQFGLDGRATPCSRCTARPTSTTQGQLGRMLDARRHDRPLGRRSCSRCTRARASSSPARSSGGGSRRAERRHPRRAARLPRLRRPARRRAARADRLRAASRRRRPCSACRA